jgi:hypothetical protein
MKLSAFKQHLDNTTALHFMLPNGTFIPSHFHITEAGLMIKNFIDCGGTIRSEKAATMQLWVDSDFTHRLEPQKLLKILALSESLFGTEDLDVEIEYQNDTIGRYGVTADGNNFILTAKPTDCLAKENCGTSKENPSFIIAGNETNQNSCTPGGSCC